MATVNERIRTLRKYLKLKQQDFAKEIGISRTHISNIENGNDNPSSSLLKLICIKFNIDESWLIDGIGDDNYISSQNFNTITNDGLMSKYNDSRVSFEQMLRIRQGNELKHSVLAFSYLTGILSTNNLESENHEKYLSNIFCVIDDLEKLTASVSSINTLMPTKHKEKYLDEFKLNAEKRIQEINQKMIDAVDVYLKQFDINIDW